MDNFFKFLQVFSHFFFLKTEVSLQQPFSCQTDQIFQKKNKNKSPSLTQTKRDLSQHQKCPKKYSRRIFVLNFLENFLSPSKDNLQKVTFAWTQKFFENCQKKSVCIGFWSCRKFPTNVIFFQKLKIEVGGVKCIFSGFCVYQKIRPATRAYFNSCGGIQTRLFLPFGQKKSCFGPFWAKKIK